MRTMDRGLPPSAYHHYIASSAWAAQKERWRRRHSHQRRCAACGDRRYDLHHRSYVRLGRERMGAGPWRGDLVPLCHRHHSALHRWQDRMGWTVQRASGLYLVGAGARRGIKALLTTSPGWVLGAAMYFLLLR